MVKGDNFASLFQLMSFWYYSLSPINLCMGEYINILSWLETLLLAKRTQQGTIGSIIFESNRHLSHEEFLSTPVERFHGMQKTRLALVFEEVPSYSNGCTT